MSKGNSEVCHSDTQAQLLELYTRLATKPDTDFGWNTGKGNARQLGYEEAWLETLPACVWESAAAVGNPFSLAPIEAGEIVVDLGCGAGADACVAGFLVGESGQVHGFDCTPAMIDKAIKNASACEFDQVIFRKAEMTVIPLPDASVDAVISNGAINLAVDKETVLKEILRVLKPGSRLQMADMVRDPSASSSACESSEDSWADCVSGTLLPEVFLEMLDAAGFVDAKLSGYTEYRTSASTIGALFSANKAG